MAHYLGKLIIVSKDGPISVMIGNRVSKKEVVNIHAFGSSSEVIDKLIHFVENWILDLGDYRGYTANQKRDIYFALNQISEDLQSGLFASEKVANDYRVTYKIEPYTEEVDTIL